MDGGIVWIGKWPTRIPIFLLKPSYNYNGSKLAFFSYCRLNFVANHNVMNCTIQSSKHDLACISLLCLFSATMAKI